MRIQQDKLQHALCSMTLLLALLYITGGLLPAVSIAIGIGATKELFYDLYLNKGTPDWYDMLANSLGVIFGTILVIIFEAIRML